MLGVELDMTIWWVASVTPPLKNPGYAPVFAIGQVCVDIKYVSTGKAYWLDDTTFARSDNGLNQMIDSLCKYVFAAASSTCLSSYLVFSKTPRNYRCYVGPGSW